MKLKLELNFCTDGDFCFLDTNPDHLLNGMSMYKDVVKEFKVDDRQNEERLHIFLDCEGKANGCRWAARDVLENLISGGFRVVHYWLVDDLYHLITAPIDVNCEQGEMLWSNEDVNHYGRLSGNYEGTDLLLWIRHEDSVGTEESN